MTIALIICLAVLGVAGWWLAIYHHRDHIKTIKIAQSNIQYLKEEIQIYKRLWKSETNWTFAFIFVAVVFAILAVVAEEKLRRLKSA